MKRYLFGLMVVWLAAGCTSATPEQTPVAVQATEVAVTATAAATATKLPAPVVNTPDLPTALPTEPAVDDVEESETSVDPTATATATMVAEAGGRTSEGAYFAGRDDAPVTIIDYSDFL